jgi:hypothetical protein
VIAILAPRSLRGPHQIADVAHVLISAMTDLGASRLVITSAYPLVAKAPRLPLAVLRRALAGTYADLAQMGQAVSGSRLAWTIVRLNRLTDAPPCGGTRISPGLLEKPAPVTRADAAAVLLDIVQDGTFSTMSVNVAGPARSRGRTRTKAWREPSSPAPGLAGRARRWRPHRRGVTSHAAGRDQAGRRPGPR